MAYAIFCLDKPNAVQLRLDNRAAHLDFAKSWGDAIAIGGPLFSEPDDDSEPEMIGSLIILDVDTRGEVDRFIACDPYGIAGLFDSVTVHPYKIALGKNVG